MLVSNQRPLMCEGRPMDEEALRRFFGRPRGSRRAAPLAEKTVEGPGGSRPSAQLIGRCLRNAKTSRQTTIAWLPEVL